MVGVRSLLWFGKVLWVELWRHSEAAELRLIDHTRKTMNSGAWDLIVILLLLRVLYAKKDCTVLDI